MIQSHCSVKCLLGKSDKKTQSEHRQELTKKIMSETYKLFRAQGYEKTTMRQIALKSGILIGSLYNIFASKEEIFEAIILDKYNLALEMSKKMIQHGENHILVMGFPLGVALHISVTDERSAELLHIALSNWNITSKIMIPVNQWVKDEISKLGVNMTDEIIRSNTLALFGSITNFIARIRYETRNDYHMELISVMEMFCALFFLPSSGVNEMADSMIEVLNKNDFSSFLE